MLGRVIVTIGRAIVKGRCEGFIETTTLLGPRTIRCPRAAAHSHHMLTRARGGKILDKAGETYHLINLCARCHTHAHDDAEADLLIEGYVTTGPDGRPQYRGPDPYLKAKYPYDKEDK